jgi:hypothetical protein
VMNEQIEELARKAAGGMLSFDAEGEWRLSQSETEKFAKLLIEDVLSELEYERGYYSEPMGYQESEEYHIQGAAKQEILDEVIGNIKHRYGLK